jgi:hypothetical protein
LRDLRRAHVATGALILGIPATAGAVTGGHALAQSVDAGPTPSAGALPAKLVSSHVHFGRRVVVTGNAPTADAGHTVELQFARAGRASWSRLASGTIAADGSYRLSAPVRHSGLLQVQDSGSTSGTPQATAHVANTPNGGAQRIAVAAAVRLRERSINVLGGQAMHVRGKLLPGVSGRRVRLEGRAGHGWRTLTTARTGGRGGFDLGFVPSAPGRQQLRVRFAGDRLNTDTGARAGVLTAYRASQASWYSDGATTGCGFHAYYGVANTSLPCGTKVTFFNGGRTVTATVDDRGPYVGGRDWDLNQNTAAALGFGGVGTVWSSV